MPTVTYDVVRIRVSELQTTEVRSAPWETPILEAMYGEDCEVVGSENVEREALPDAGDEFTRLANRYGPRNEDTPYVAAVYGNFGIGTRKLGEEIAQCGEASPAEPDEDDDAADLI